METNYSYNSYPESGDSSPRSREIDFENPAPWEDQNYKMKFMCSYGGKIHPRPHDNQLSYIGGETKILAVDRNTKFSQMISKLSAVCSDTDVSFKYQLPGEDLDALISVTNDDDLDHMMHEYDRLYRASAKPARMRLFLFPVACTASFGSDVSSKSDRDRFVEALNSCHTQSIEKQTTPPPNNNVDFLFGLDHKVKLPEPVAPPSPPPPPPPPPVEHDRVVAGSDHVLNPADIQRQLNQLQRLQIREQIDHQNQQQVMHDQHDHLQQQQAAMYAAGPGDYFVQQKIMEKATLPPMTTTTAVQQPSMSPPPGFWQQEKQIPGGGYPTNLTTPPPPPEQQMYMIQAQAPGNIYHHAPVMRQMTGQMTGQASQGGYYTTNVQRMPPDVYREQQMYNVVQQQQTQPPPQVFPPQPGMGVVRPSGNDTGYGQQIAYDNRQVYYTAGQGGVVVPPQYQGAGVPVSSGGDIRLGQDGKGVPKASQASV